MIPTYDYRDRRRAREVEADKEVFDKVADKEVFDKVAGKGVGKGVEEDYRFVSLEIEMFDEDKGLEDKVVEEEEEEYLNFKV